jgi:RNA polymerase sigma-70 factor (ECF subfamily)
MGNYLASLHESQAALKRGGRVRTVPLDFELAERDIAGVSATPDAAFNREWALSVMERALQRLREEFESGVRRGPYEVFAKSFGLGKAPSYAEAAAECQMPVSQFKAFLNRTRVRFRELVRQEVLQTVTEERETDAEIGELLQALSS